MLKHVHNKFSTSVRRLYKSCIVCFETISAINCDTLAEPLNGHVIGGSGYQIGSTRRYACDRGYDLHGAESIRCEEQNGRGVWSALIPTCQSNCSFIFNSYFNRSLIFFVQHSPI